MDRAALEAALANEIEIGGYVPRGRLAEDGRVPEKYTGLIETNSESYAERTRLNIINSDATLLLTNGEPAGGSKLTADLAGEYRKPLFHVDLSKSNPKEALNAVNGWLRRFQLITLNVAGPRASEAPAIYDLTLELLSEVLKKAGRERPT